MNALAEQPFVVVDTETTGHAPSKGHRIVEIGAVRVVDGIVTDDFLTLVNPDREIPPWVTRIHGISDDMVVSAPSMDSVMLADGGFLDYVGTDPIVMHNAPFDTAFINAAIEELTGQKLGNTILDTLKISRRLLKHLPNHKLGTVAGYFNISFPAHTALGDALMTAGVFNECLLMEMQAGVTALEEFCGKYKFKYNKTVRPLKSGGGLFDGALKILRRDDASAWE